MQEVFSTSLTRHKDRTSRLGWGRGASLAVHRWCQFIRWLSVFQVVQASVALEALTPMSAKTSGGDGHQRINGHERNNGHDRINCRLAFTQESTV